MSIVETLVASSIALTTAVGVVALGAQYSAWSDDQAEAQAALTIATRYFENLIQPCAHTRGPINLSDAYQALPANGRPEIPEDTSDWWVQISGDGVDREWVSVYRTNRRSAKVSTHLPKPAGELGTELLLALDPHINCRTS